MEAVGQLASGIAHEINSPSQFANDNILFLKDAVEGFIAEIDKTDKAPDEKELRFLKENSPQAVEQAKEGIGRITTIVKSMKNFAYRDANSEKKPNDLNHAIRSTTVVATNEWKYHAEMQLNLDESLPMVPCNIGEINPSGPKPDRQRRSCHSGPLRRKSKGNPDRCLQTLPGCELRGDFHYG